ncbi:MAG: hypothetical protein IZT55_05295 [Anaerolineae bacterium]|nr:hypothetical protein [Anaerolineae bacterium]
MVTSVVIQRVEVDGELFEMAVYLLRRFFDEEGFETPSDEMRASLKTMVKAANNAVILARIDTESIGVAAVTTEGEMQYKLLENYQKQGFFNSQREIMGRALGGGR